MGGSIAKFAAQGHDVLLLDVTNGEPTPHGTVEKREREAEAAAKILSPDPGRFPEGRPVRRVQLGLPNRYVEHDVESRHKVAGVIRAHQAEILFVPFPEDAHPDHRAVTRICEDARFDAKLSKVDMPHPEPHPWVLPEIGPPIYPKWLFYYYCTHLRWLPDPNFLIDISGFLEQKMASIRAYETQFVIPEKNRRVMEWLEAGAKYLGSRIGTDAAEPFFTKEPLGLTGLGALA